MKLLNQNSGSSYNAFLHNDIYRATQQFLRRAEGSFGLVTVSTLSAERLVLSAQGQPMTIGFKGSYLTLADSVSDSSPEQVTNPVIAFIDTV
jgi:glucosamine 6-phosphate synthetase-like amidotransferase/phosphosugar isomerase protein